MGRAAVQNPSLFAPSFPCDWHPTIPLHFNLAISRQRLMLKMGMRSDLETGLTRLQNWTTSTSPGPNGIPRRGTGTPHRCPLLRWSQSSVVLPLPHPPQTQTRQPLTLPRIHSHTPSSDGKKAGDNGNAGRQEQEETTRRRKEERQRWKVAGIEGNGGRRKGATGGNGGGGGGQQ